ncbi:MAG: hypothetical protein EP343_08120 [Deltaproteobacteria bacterium]|nr:MAG: hypothetical protein EP343_08120 [Deltaproteobacteria bacterium]
MWFTRMLLSLGFLGLIGLGVVEQPCAWAAASKPSLDKVKTLFRKGRALFVKRQFAASIKPLRSSFDMLGQLIKQSNSPDEKKKYRKYEKAFLATLAIAYHWNKDYVQSYQFYTRCVAAKASEKLEQLCRANLPKVLRFLARLEIETNPKRATLSLTTGSGSGIATQAPLKKWVKPGAISVRVQAKGYVSLQRQLVLKPGIQARFLFQLQKPSCPPSQAPKPVVASSGDRLALSSLGVTPTLAAGAPPAPAVAPQPFASPGLVPWQIGLVVAGAVAGAALIGLGSYGVYTAVNNSNSKFVIR